jgi:hypothetical protein
MTVLVDGAFATSVHDIPANEIQRIVILTPTEYAAAYGTSRNAAGPPNGAVLIYTFGAGSRD